MLPPLSLHGEGVVPIRNEQRRVCALLWLRGIKLCPGSEPHPGESKSECISTNMLFDASARRASDCVWGVRRACRQVKYSASLPSCRSRLSCQCGGCLGETQREQRRRPWKGRRVLARRKQNETCCCRFCRCCCPSQGAVFVITRVSAALCCRVSNRIHQTHASFPTCTRMHPDTQLPHLIDGLNVRSSAGALAAERQ